MHLLLSVLVIAAFVAAAVWDLAERRIPNRLVAALALIGLVRIIWELAAGEGPVRPVDPAADVAAALAVFAVGAAVFHLNLVGGGDVKLLAGGALWLGAGAVWPFLFVTALAGGVLSVVYMVRAAASGPAQQGSDGLPYGVAIAAGGILATAAAL